MDPRLKSPFFLKRLLFMLLVPLPISAALFVAGQGVPGLVVMLVGSWPFPFRCSADAGGLTISWLPVREHIRWEDIRLVALVEDPRPGVIGKRKPVLTIERKQHAPVTLRGRSEVLTGIAAEIARFTQEVQ
jgi:hypothetical protein